MAVGTLALLGLVVFPLLSLVWGTLTIEGRLPLDHFREALGRRLYLQALWNSLVLGGWTAGLSVLIGLPMAWAVGRTDVPGRRFIHLYRFILFEYDVTRRAISNSLVLAAEAATAAVGLGSLIAWIDLRTTLRGRKLLDHVSLIPLGLPGIVVAVALIQFWLRLPVPIYGTLLIILLAYTARYVPLGVRSANSVLRQIDPPLEERARDRRRVAPHLRQGDVAPGPARAARGLAARLRAGSTGTERVDPALQLPVTHPGRGRLQPL